MGKVSVSVAQLYFNDPLLINPHVQIVIKWRQAILTQIESCSDSQFTSHDASRRKNGLPLPRIPPNLDFYRHIQYPFQLLHSLCLCLTKFKAKNLV